MMATTAGVAYLWVIFWTVLGLVLAVTGAVVAARILGGRSRDAAAHRIGAKGSAGLQAARDILRLRYARGEISREEYLQGRVELED